MIRRKQPHRTPQDRHRPAPIRVENGPDGPLYSFPLRENPASKARIVKPYHFSPSIEGVDVRSAEFLQTFAWRKLRYHTLAKRGGRCECCGARPSADNGVIINVDHIKPRLTHPELALEPRNLQVLCHECNSGKGNQDKTDWRHR